MSIGLPIFYKPHQIIEFNKKNRLKESPLSSSEVLVSQKWLLRLRQCYSHFCKSTYAIGKSSTFDQIQTKTNTMTVSNFIHFCRSYNIKLDLIKLMDIFKKVTNFSMAMKFQQLIQALYAISLILFPLQKQSREKEEVNQFMEIQEVSQANSKINSNDKQSSSKKLAQPPNFQNFLRLISLDSTRNFKEFKLKLETNSRKHGFNAHQNLIKLNPTSQYKFKLAALNGKNKQQIKEELELRKNSKLNTKKIIKEHKEFQNFKNQKKFVQLNKISISEKKILKGGYMSPPLAEDKILSCEPNSGQTKLSYSKASTILFDPSQGFNLPLSNINTELMIASNKAASKKFQPERHHTQFNTYSNSLENSIHIENSEAKSNEGYGKNQKRQEKGIDGYLNSYKGKINKKYCNRYELSNVIKQARQQSSVEDKSINRKNESQLTSKANSLKKKIVTEPNPQQSTLNYLQYLVGDLGEEDQFLQSLNGVQNQQKISKKRLITQFIY